jgi:tripartite-type tricarboxylate transporter receptor subunit TctC
LQDDLSRRRWLTSAGALCGAQLLPGWASAQSRLPTLRLLVGFPAGAGIDPVARAIGEKLRGGLWANVIVENRAGAGGRIAIDALKQAPPDGATLLLTPASTLTLYPHVFRKLSYHPVDDLIPVSQAFSFQMGLIAGPANPAKTLKEYVAWVRKSPNNAMYATPALGNVPHFLASMFEKAAGIDLQAVAYKGSAPIWTDLLGGQIPSYFSPIGNDAISRHREGKVRILAIADQSRSKFLPDVPTFAESGYPSIVIDEWFGFFAPPRTPMALVEAQNAALRGALREPEVAGYLEKYLAEPQPSTSAALAERIKAETPRWAAVVKASGFTPED